jgi:hypothetical protein
MSKDPIFERAIAAQLACKAAEGWHRPCVVMLPPLAPFAPEVYRALTGKPLGPVPPGRDPAELAVQTLAPAEELAAALTEHAGPAGAVVARHLTDPAVSPAEGWLVLLLADAIFAAAYLGDREVLRIQQPHGDARGQTLGEMLTDGGPSHFTLQAADGQELRVFGRTGGDAARAGALVALALHRSVPLPHPVTGETVTIPVDDDGLASLLANVYGRDEDGAHQVAEAIMTLRRQPGDQARWLLRVLRNHPALADLNRRVQMELTGEAPPAA